MPRKTTRAVLDRPYALEDPQYAPPLRWQPYRAHGLAVDCGLRKLLVKRYELASGPVVLGREDLHNLELMYRAGHMDVTLLMNSIKRFGAIEVWIGAYE
jgi:hypothetical protein